MAKQEEQFHRRLQGLAQRDYLPDVNRNYLSDRFAKELRKARNDPPERGTFGNGRTGGCVQVLKPNVPMGQRDRPTAYTREELPISARVKPIKRTQSQGDSAREPPQRTGTGGDNASRGTTIRCNGGHDEESFADSATDQRKPTNAENVPPVVPPEKESLTVNANNETRSLQEFEKKVEVLNTQAQQLLKQLRREQVERERMAKMYDDALDEIRLLRERERERPSSQDLEARIRRLECERDEAFAKNRTAQVDNEELRIKLERSSEENSRDRQRLADKVVALEHRLNATEADRDELSRRHSRNLETVSKLEVQVEEQKVKLATAEELKQNHLKQIENLGLFVNDLEQNSKQLQERLDEKRYEMHQSREKMTELEDLLVKMDQHLLQEKERFIQMQNDAYQAQVRNQEVRTDLRNAMKKKTKHFD